MKLSAMDFYMANNPTFVALHPEIKNKMIEKAKEFPPQDCQCCFFFKWLFGNDKKICGGSCAANQEIKPGEFEYFKIPKGCPVKGE